MTIGIPVRSKCCEAPVRLGYRKIKNTNKKTQMWICCHCKKRDVDILPVVNGKVVRVRPFADESEFTLDDGEITGYDRSDDQA